jgi:hypothetical protein
MQKIFIVHGDYLASPSDKGSFHLVNDFIGMTGLIISVTPQTVYGAKDEIRGRWLVVADDGLGQHKTL